MINPWKVEYVSLCTYVFVPVINFEFPYTDPKPFTDELTITRIPQNLTMEEGQSAVMECSAEGNGMPVFSWVRQGKLQILGSLHGGESIQVGIWVVS